VVSGCRVPVIQFGDVFIFLKLGLLLGFLDDEASAFVWRAERELREFVIH
jgi:hypothetical protein